MKFFVAFVALIAVAAANPLNTWNLHDLSEALSNPNTNPAYLPYLEFALNHLMSAIHGGAMVDSIVVPAPVNIGVPTTPSAWSLQELSAAFENPDLNPALVPYLEDALDELMSSIFSGQNVNSIIVYLPVGVPVVIPKPVVPEVIPEAVIPAPVPSPKPISSPLVQIIVKVNGQQQHAANIKPQAPRPDPLLRH